MRGRPSVTILERVLGGKWPVGDSQNNVCLNGSGTAAWFFTWFHKFPLFVHSHSAYFLRVSGDTLTVRYPSFMVERERVVIDLTSSDHP